MQSAAVTHDDAQRSRPTGVDDRSSEPPSFTLYFNQHYSWSDTLIDCLTIVSGKAQLGLWERWLVPSSQ